MSFSVLLVDDHKLLREGIKNILERTTEFHILGEGDNGSDAVRLCKKLRPDLVLMDLALEGMNGIEATPEIIRQSPSTKVVILSMHEDENSVVAAFRAGARGFLSKGVSGADLVDALRTVAKGGSYLSSGVSDRLLARIQRGDVSIKNLAAPLETLSSGEQQVLRLIADGSTTREIADQLQLPLQAVRKYRKALMKKLNVSSTAALTQIAVAARLTGWRIREDLK